jgi:hypothetical protein
MGPPSQQYRGRELEMGYSEGQIQSPTCNYEVKAVD